MNGAVCQEPTSHQLLLLLDVARVAAIQGTVFAHEQFALALEAPIPHAKRMTSRIFGSFALGWTK